MKIGEFAKKHGVKISTVRYYIDNAMITPRRENNQYILDETCDRQMEKILRLKNYRFKLSDIEKICFYENATNLKDREVLKHLIRIFRDKEAKIKDDISELQSISGLLESEIDRYREKLRNAEAAAESIVPIEALGIMCCPYCGKSLHISGAEIRDNGIYDAQISCRCGFSAPVRSGMIVLPDAQNESPFRLFDNENLVLSSETDFSASYLLLLDKGHIDMYQNIDRIKEDVRYVLCGPLSFSFILKNISMFSEDTVIFINDISMEKIKKHMTYFSDLKQKVVYIAGDIRTVPLKKDSIDLYIDDFSIVNYIVPYNYNIAEKAAEFVRSGGYMAGLLVDYSKAPQTLAAFREDHPEFIPGLLSTGRIKSVLSDAGFDISYIENLGSSKTGEKNFARHSGNETISLLSYMAKKI